ncbi:MAG: hypothetical protein RSA10_03715 [Bacilli bacterium]
MRNIAIMGLQFIIVFWLIYLIYYFIYYKKLKKFNRKTAPITIKYLMYKYGLDVVKVGYKKVYKNTMIADSFIVASIFVLTTSIDNIYIRLIACFVFIFPAFAGVYHVMAIYYKKMEDN